MPCDIDVDAGECWLKVSLENGRTAPDFSPAREAFYRKGDELNIHGQISEVFKYFFNIPENDVKEVHCQVNLHDQWIHKKMEFYLSGLDVICKANNLYGPNKINFEEIDQFLQSIENILSNHPPENSMQEGYENSLSSANSIFEVEEIRWDKDEIYSMFLDKIFMPSRTCSMCGICNLDDMKTFSKKMEILSDKACSDIVDIHENVWLYLLGHESDKIEQILSKNGCSCEIITGPNNSKQLKILSVQDNSDIDEAMNTIIEMYQGYALKNIIAEDMIIEEPKEYELAKKYVNDKKMYGRCSYKVCGPKSDLSDFKTKFESREHKKNEKKGKSKAVSENDVRVEHALESGLKIFISKGNLVHQRTDAIVNPANSRLAHGGGAAAAIAKAAGEALEAECKEFIKKEKSLPVTKAMHTTAGSLKPNIKYVIHTVGPQIKESRNARSEMVETFLNCFKYANDKLSISSMAVPAISSGIYGVPLEVVGSATFQALDIFEKERKNKTLKEIHFVNIDEATVEKICKAFKNWNKGSDVDGKQHRHVEDGDVQEVPSDETTDEKRNGKIPMDVDDSAAPFNEKLKDAEPKKVYSSSYRSNTTEDVNDTIALVVLSKKPKREAQKDVDNEKAATSIGPSTKSKEQDKKEDICAICMDEITHPEELKCGHAFCKDCLKEYNKRCSPKCPTCGMIYGEVRGNQPPGQMEIKKQYGSLPGYRYCGYLEIVYNIWSGIQNETHPNPGRPFRGIHRTAYLPDNEEGREVANMLRRAFDNQLIFTIGRSHTTGLEDAVVWNDIHHKTAKHGDRYAYPDPEYLKRVKEELAAKGIYPEGQGKK